MRRWIIAALSVPVLGLIAYAGEGKAVISVTTGSTAGTAVATTNTGFIGKIHSVVFDVPTATACTGATLVVTTLSDITTEAAQTLATTGSIAADTLVFPRYVGVATDGTGETTDKPWQFYCIGERLVFTVTGAAETNVTVKAIIKYEKE